MIKSVFKNLSVINKILIVIALNVPVFIAICVVSYRGLSKSEEIKNQIVENNNASINQLTADMMRDALRADLYAALLVDSTNRGDAETILSDLNEHVSIFKSSLASLNNSDVNQQKW